MSVRLMLCGEVAVVTSTWRYAYEGRQDAPQVRTSIHGLTDTCVPLPSSPSKPFVTIPMMLPGLQGLTPGGGVEFEVELVGFEQEASHHAMSGTDKLERAGRLKTQGNALFKQVIVD